LREVSKGRYNKNLDLQQFCAKIVICMDSKQRKEYQFYGQNHWLSGLYPPSSVLKTRKHNVLETGPVSVLR
jgi:hypothetical protein